MMKKWAFLSLLVFACGSATPEDVAQGFANAMKEKNWDKVRELTTENSHKIVKMMEGMAAMDDVKQGDVQIQGPTFAEMVLLECETKDETAICHLEDEKNGVKPYNLVKVDGKWKVDLKKD